MKQIHFCCSPVQRTRCCKCWANLPQNKPQETNLEVKVGSNQPDEHFRFVNNKVIQGLHSCCAPTQQTRFCGLSKSVEVGRPKSASREKQPQCCRFRNKKGRNKQRYKLKLLFAQTTSTHLSVVENIQKSIRRSLSLLFVNSQIISGREAKRRQAASRDCY